VNQRTWIFPPGRTRFEPFLPAPWPRCAPPAWW